MKQQLKKGLTFDVDVLWKDKPPIGWKKYEINPKTPNHKFA